MKKIISLSICVITCIISFIGCSKEDTPKPIDNSENLQPVLVQKANKTKIYVHYMPWFETNVSSPDKKWGSHWTMANKNPDVIVNGKRQIASHFYPLIGPYHSGDKEVIENHLLMMKYAGIDGVLIDWYGTYNLNDYAINKENSEQLIAMLEKVGLEYAIVYEDRFLPRIVEAGLAPNTVSAAKRDLAYMQTNYFNDSNYIKINSLPLLLNFGPVSLTNEADWTSAFSVLSKKPVFLTYINNYAKAGANAAGEFAWPYQNNEFLPTYYNNSSKFSVFFGCAYPGFKDFYAQGGVSDAIGWSIDHNNGATMDYTLALAKERNLNYLQLVTWNDFGEGTVIEPTVEFGYTFLEKIKTYAGVQYTGSYFANISKLYNLRKSNISSVANQQKLDQAFAYFVAMQPDKAVEILNQF